MDYNLIPPEELGKGSSIKLDVSQTEVDIYWKVAIKVLETIEENNRCIYTGYCVVSIFP